MNNGQRVFHIVINLIAGLFYFLTWKYLDDKSLHGFMHFICSFGVATLVAAIIKELINAFAHESFGVFWGTRD